MARTLLAALALATLVSGCSLPVKYHSIARDRYVLVHEDGYPVAPANIVDPLPPDAWRTWVTSVVDSIDAYLRAPRKSSQPHRVVLFIPGGVNGHKQNLDRVHEYLAYLGSNEAPWLAHAHLVFLNWNSDLWGSLLDDLCCIRRGERRSAFAWTGLPALAASRLTESAFRLPLSVWFQWDNAFAGFVRPPAADACLAGGEPIPGFFERIRHIGTDPGDLDPRYVLSYGAFLPLRALSVPVIQAFGTQAWGTMKRRADLVTAPEFQVERASRVNWKAEGAGRALVAALAARLSPAGRWRLGGSTDPKDEVEVEFALVGHSMGTIVANRLLHAVPAMRYDRIVYLAAGASIDEVLESVVPYMRAQTRDVRFWAFSLPDSLEAREINFVDVYERGSLLVWVDYLFERPNHPGGFTFGRTRNLRLYFKKPEDLRERINLVEFSGDRGGAAAGKPEPRKHGELGDPAIANRALQMAFEQRSCETAGDQPRR